MSMRVLVSHPSFDSLDAFTRSRFWGSVLGFFEDPDDPNRPGNEECMMLPTDGTQRLLFIGVPEVKLVKDRVHLDLKPAEGIRDEELDRLLDREPTKLPTCAAPTGQDGSCSPIRMATSSALSAVTPNMRWRGLKSPRKRNDNRALFMYSSESDRVRK